MNNRTVIFISICLISSFTGFSADAQRLHQLRDTLVIDSLLTLAENADLPTPQRFYYAQKAYNLANQKSYKKRMFSAKIEMALNKKNLQQYAEAFLYLQNAYEFAEKEANIEQQMIALNHFGMFYTDVNQQEKARESYLQLGEISENNNKFYYTYLSKLNLASLYYQKKDAAKTIACAESARDNAYKARRYCKGIALAYANLASGFYLVNNYAKAHYFLDSSKMILDTMIHLDKPIAADVYWRTGEVCKAEGKYTEAIFWFEKCVNLHQQCEKAVRKNLIELYEKRGDYTKAANSYRAIACIDSTYRSNLEKESFKNIMSVHDLSEEKQRNQALESEQLRLYWSIPIGFLIFLVLYQQYKNIKVRKTLLESQLEASEKTRELQALEQQKLKETVETQQEDLKNMAIEIARKNEFLAELKHKVQPLNAAMNDDNFEALQNLVRQNALNNEKDIVEFKWQVDAWNSIFYEKLRQRASDLSPTELEICGLIRLNLSSKEIASIRNIEPKSVDMSRWRLRKKLNLKPDDDLIFILQSI
jgi:DNA-binding CsgD family transcriptional regulator